MDAQGGEALARVVYQGGQALSSLRFFRHDLQGFPHTGRHQWRRRSGENEAPSAIDQMIAHDGGPAQKRSFASQGFATGAQDNGVGSAIQIGGQPSTPLTPNARSMGIIGIEHGTVAICEFQKIGQRRTIAIHAVEGFNGNPRSACCTVVSPVAKHIGKSLHIIVSNAARLSPGKAHAFMRARMDEFIVTDDVPALRQS
ncbi:hypothetical protein TMRH483_02551 [Qipengyuania sp. 483]